MADAALRTTRVQALPPFAYCLVRKFAADVIAKTGHLDQLKSPQCRDGFLTIGQLAVKLQQTRLAF